MQASGDSRKEESRNDKTVDFAEPEQRFLGLGEHSINLPKDNGGHGIFSIRYGRRDEEGCRETESGRRKRKM